MFSRALWLEAVHSETSWARGAYTAVARGVLELRAAVEGCLCPRPEHLLPGC